ncbi:SsrA-binding protein SmpB [Planotetraspora kaengkrachanensis]|uniref:SsrA-binding protein n=1 Tax=Planotetraspora kaengkrachanensis TaxID=575193 RepID=A0A8J3PVJ7_9ACTN|nr:SsrA-binding protein SmpB [Planotetraspora kaengkrachanensis]GIG81726.1 SsrA-binding protein [Planotetraspora kaengkrachanensis]
MPREIGRKLIAQNKRARHEYFIEDTYEAGLVLTGTEVKSLRAGKANLTDGYASVENGEAWLINVYIPEYSQGTWTNHASRRTRKLLLHGKEISKISATLKERGLTLIPLSMYFKDGKAKIEIGVARGKKDYDKRQTLMEKQANRDMARAMSNAVRRRGGR